MTWSVISNPYKMPGRLNRCEYPNINDYLMYEQVIIRVQEINFYFIQQMI